MTATLNDSETKYWQQYKVDLLQGIDDCLKQDQLLAVGKLIFCAIDSLAAFYIGYNDNRSKNQKVMAGGGGRSQGNIYENSSVGKYFDNYLKNCCDKIYRENIELNTQKEALRDLLYNDYRCGLVHEGRPKRNLGTNKNNKLLFSDSSLSMTKMRDLLSDSIKVFDKELKSNDYRVRRWRDRYNYLTT